MHSGVVSLCLVWLFVMAVILVIHAACTKRRVLRVLSLDTLALIVVGVLSLSAVRFEDARMLDIALVVAMVGFLQTLAAVWLIEKRPEIR